MIKNKEELLSIIEFGKDIKKIINEWDPINLLNTSPEDEYEMEIREIRNKALVKDITIEKLSISIKNIFENYFLDEYISKSKIEYEISARILEKKKKYRLPFLVNNKVRYINVEDAELYLKIKNIINKWDPLKIINFSFSNEYCYEIDEILCALKKNINVKDLQEEIRKIFKNSYNEIYNLSEHEEAIISNKILQLKNFKNNRNI